jgi:hypothetical protein
VTSTVDRLAAFRDGKPSTGRHARQLETQKRPRPKAAPKPALVSAVAALSELQVKLSRVERAREAQLGPVAQRALHQLRVGARVLLQERAELVRRLEEAEQQAADARAGLARFDEAMAVVDAMLWEHGARLAPASAVLAVVASAQRDEEHGS